MVLNLDQTPLRYSPCSRQTLAQKKSNNFLIPFLYADPEKGITGIFVITLYGNFLPFQLIYGGKTERSLPKFKYPVDFSLRVNEKHF